MTECEGEMRDCIPVAHVHPCVSVAPDKTSVVLPLAFHLGCDSETSGTPVLSNVNCSMHATRLK